MKLSRLFCALMVLAVVFAAFGLNAFAGKYISSVAIEGLESPVIGWEPGYNWTVADHSGFTSITPGPGGLWYESEDGKDFKRMATNYEAAEDRPLFRENWYYRFVTQFQPEKNCAWNEEVLTVTVNGSPAEFTLSGDVLTVTKNYGPLTWDGLQAFVNVSDVVPPVAGADVYYSFAIDEYSHVTSCLPGAGCRWDESSDGGLTWTTLSTSEPHKYKSGCTYRFYIEVQADAGYTLAGSFGATVNGNNASTVAKTVGDKDTKVGVIAYVFPTLGENALTVKPADGEKSFSTYYAEKDFNVKVEVENANGSVNIEWFYCDGMGEKYRSDPFGKGYSVMLNGISGNDMMVEKYVLVVVQETGGSKRTAAAVIPYVLLPMGYEGGNEPVKVTVAQGETIVVKEAGKPIQVEAVLENNVSECSVDWFPCDSEGHPDRAHPLGNGYDIELPAISEKDAGKVIYYEVYAEDDRGYAYGGHCIFSVMLEKKASEPETPEPSDTPEPSETPTSTAEDTPEPQDTAAPDPTKAPEVTDTALPVETTAGPASTPDLSGATAEPGKTGGGMDVLLIVLIIVASLALCAACVLIGLLIGKKRA